MQGKKLLTLDFFVSFRNGDNIMQTIRILNRTTTRTRKEVNSKNGDRKIIQSIRIFSESPTRMTKEGNSKKLLTLTPL